MKRYETRLRDVLTIAPANLVARLKLIDALAREGQADSAVRQLEEVRRIPPSPPPEARAYLDSSIQFLRAGEAAGSRSALDHFLGLMESTAPYQAALDEVRWTDGPIAGRAVLAYAPKNFISLRGVRAKPTVDEAKFTDATNDAGLASPETITGDIGSSEDRQGPTAIAAGDIDGDGEDDLFVSMWSPVLRKNVQRVYHVQGAFVRDVTAHSKISLRRSAAFATFADYDNDGWLDLFVIGSEGRGHLFRNTGNGTFSDVTSKAGVSDVKGARKAVFVDLDHDGDLDLLLVGNGQRTAYRNNLDGTFTDATAAVGLGGGEASDAVFGDFDGDGRTDVFFSNEHGADALFHNGGAQHFTDATASSGIASGGSGTAAVGDYNNDGFLDIFVASAKGEPPTLWLNKGNGSFARDPRSSAALQALRATGGMATFVDYDNDG
jgi:hypothetical protein